MTFRAKYDGVCALCGYSFEKGEDIKTVNEVKYAHDNCTESEDFEHTSIRQDYRATYERRGKVKDNPICKSCNTIHPVGTDCW